MRKKLIFISSTLCFAILLSACGKKPVDEAVNNKVTASTPDNKIDTIKQEVKKVEPAEAPKQEVKKEEVKKETPKQAPVATTNTNKPAEQPKTVAPATATTTTSVAPAPLIKDAFQTAMEGAIPNNGRYKVTFDKTSGPVPYGLIYYIENISAEKEKNSNICGYVVSNNKLLASNDSFYGFEGNNKFKGFLSIPGSNNNPPSVDCYIIIPSKEDGKTYYEKMTFTITK